MIYTYDKTTGLVVMISEGKNEYDNPNYADIEVDASYDEAKNDFEKRADGSLLYLDKYEEVTSEVIANEKSLNEVGSEKVAETTFVYK